MNIDERFVSNSFIVDFNSGKVLDEGQYFGREQLSDIVLFPEPENLEFTIGQAQNVEVPEEGFELKITVLYDDNFQQRFKGTETAR